MKWVIKGAIQILFLVMFVFLFFVGKVQIWMAIFLIGVIGALFMAAMVITSKTGIKIPVLPDLAAAGSILTLFLYLLYGTGIYAPMEYYLVLPEDLHGTTGRWMKVIVLNAESAKRYAQGVQ